jgi:hypothetical protein
VSVQQFASLDGQPRVPGSTLVDGFELRTLVKSIQEFIKWLQAYGEISWDHQTYFAGRLGQWSKAVYYRRPLLGTIAVAPMVLSEALVPSARRLFARPLRFPIADAHYAMGFAFLARSHGDAFFQARARQFLGQLERSRCVGYRHHCWGYPFDWETRTGTIHEGTPLITSTPYVYEAFREVYRLDGDPAWREVMSSIAQHAVEDIKDYPTSDNASACSYTPFDSGGVINAGAYRAFLLCAASIDLQEERYWRIAERNLNFVLETQRPDGSWYYSIDGERDFVDHFHTCFVLKALSKINQMMPHDACQEAIAKGVEYYVAHLIDERGLPRPFSKAPRLTVYRRELYDYAECINLCVLLHERFPVMKAILKRVLEDVFARWIKRDGSFRSRELLFGWDNVPMHRWAQSQMFRSLSLLVMNEQCSKRSVNEVA